MQYLTDTDLAGERGCIMSDCGAYRLRLWRQWDVTLPRLGVCMLNPSDARHNVDDSTDTRIYLRAVSLGFGRYDIVNLFPLSSSKPEVMRAHPDPVGPLDIANQMILDVAADASMILCAWGAGEFAATRARAVLQLLCDAGYAEKLVHLGLNKDGSPKHPLYIAASTRPKPFEFTA
ncbi:DUF1643 domain-containing protein [Paraburkholderia nemoris]|uniref:DUF1643 domain-containing protein n=1 Tax=Paraburkholderia nemoris TaxID=2793076 RepID=UPI001B1AD8A3|nr:DUF1643 domain-containing protein [Paraburkholderia nemoris]CAE6839606.1 hypothetical protein R75777_07007 [Paraburkholderia nemoris]